MIKPDKARLLHAKLEPLHIHETFPGKEFSPYYACVTDDNLREIGIEAAHLDDHPWYGGKVMDGVGRSVNEIHVPGLLKYMGLSWADHEMLRREWKSGMEVGG